MDDNWLTQQLRPPAADTAGDPARLRGQEAVNEVAQLVADLLEPTGLVPSDRLAAARSRAGGSGSLAQALIDEGLADSVGLAKALADRYHLSYVELVGQAIPEDALLA